MFDYNADIDQTDALLDIGRRQARLMLILGLLIGTVIGWLASDAGLTRNAMLLAVVALGVAAVIGSGSRSATKVECSSRQEVAPIDVKEAVTQLRSTGGPFAAAADYLDQIQSATPKSVRRFENTIKSRAIDLRLGNRDLRSAYDRTRRNVFLDKYDDATAVRELAMAVEAMTRSRGLSLETKSFVLTVLFGLILPDAVSPGDLRALTKPWQSLEAAGREP